MKTNPELAQQSKTLSDEEKRAIRLAKRRAYDADRRKRLRLERAQQASTSSTPPVTKRPSNAKSKTKNVKKEISLPPALINAGRHSPSMLEVNVPSLPIDSNGRIIPTPPGAENNIDFEALIKCESMPRPSQKSVNGRAPLGTPPIGLSNGLSKRITRSNTVDSRSNSPKPSKNNLPSHLIQTVNYSFTSHRYNNTSNGHKRRFANFVNYSAGNLSSKTEKLSFNELRSIKDALNETWTDEERVELEQMMSRYLYDIHPVWKMKKESQIIERRDYLTNVNDSKSETHKTKDLTKILIRRDYLPKNNTGVTETGNTEEQFFRDERLVKSARSGETEFFLNDLMKGPSQDEVTTINKNDKKNYKNRFCKIVKYRKESNRASSSELGKEEDTKLKGIEMKSDEDVKNYLIATVPGMTNFEFFEMPDVERCSVVEIVHVKSADASQDSKNTSDDSNPSSSNASSGSGSVTTVVSNQGQEKKSETTTKKTPTQVTAHIQRIGHPIQISSGGVIKASTSSSDPNNRPKYLLQRTVSSPVSSSSSSTSTQLKNQTLINVLSHQVLGPGTKTTANANKITVTNGTGVAGTSSGSGTNVILNNFKAGSQTPTKIFKSFPQNWTLSPSITTNAGSSPVTVSTVSSNSQANSQHLLQILNSPPNIRKNLTITSTQQTQGEWS